MTFVRKWFKPRPGSGLYWLIRSNFARQWIRILSETCQASSFISNDARNQKPQAPKIETQKLETPKLETPKFEAPEVENSKLAPPKQLRRAPDSPGVYSCQDDL